MIDKETQRMLRARYNPDGSLLRQTQMRMLEILRHVDRSEERRVGKEC